MSYHHVQIFNNLETRELHIILQMKANMELHRKRNLFIKLRRYCTGMILCTDLCNLGSICVLLCGYN